MCNFVSKGLTLAKKSINTSLFRHLNKKFKLDALKNKNAFNSMNPSKHEVQEGPGSIIQILTS